VSRARAIHEGDTLLITRRTRGRQLLLRPSPRTNQILLYFLAVYVEHHELLLHAATFLGNHGHQVATDPRGAVTDFTRDFHSFVARHLNAVHGDFENLWSTAQTSLVRLAGGDEVIDKIAYTMANPVSSFLVTEGRLWPGVRRAWPAPPLVIKRPKGFLDEDSGRWPEEVTLTMSRPPGHDDLSDEELAARIARATEAREEAARKKATERGIRFLGRRNIRRQSRRASPRTREPHFGISPRHACKDEWMRIERLRRERDWLDAYEDALRAWRAGHRDTVFPYGTNKMRKVHRVRVAPRPG
jgi:hypothetical protein